MNSLRTPGTPLGSIPASKASSPCDSFKLDLKFYQQNDVVHISRQLLGKHIFTLLPLDPAGSGNARRMLTGGAIVETEAYAGPTDRASHAYANRRTPRTETMYRDGGIAYIYLCYGVHALFNIVTNGPDVPHAILIRAIEPTNGVDVMRRRRKYQRVEPSLSAGPGRLTQALGITTAHDGIVLHGSQIWIEDRGPPVPDQRVTASPRVGVDYAGDDAGRPWRFRIKDNAWTSRAR